MGVKICSEMNVAVLVWLERGSVHDEDNTQWRNYFPQCGSHQNIHLCLYSQLSCHLINVYRYLCTFIYLLLL